jgi:PD-(D/E)XK nuclease superfamily
MTVQPAAVVPRTRWGQPRVRDLTTGKLVVYKRVTKFIDVLEDTYLIDRSHQRNVAIGLAARHDLLMKAAAANRDRNQLEEVIDAAREAAGDSAAATLGSAVHALTEQVDRGEDPLVPPPAQPDIDAYRDLLIRERFTVAEVEVFVVCDKYKVGGTFDRIIEFEGQRYVADIKTGRIDYGASKIAMQLALYANSERYDPATGARSPLDVDTTRGIVIHLPAGGGQASLRWADLAIGWTGVQLAKDVWDWRGLSGLLEAPAPGEADLFAAIDAAPDRTALEALWAFNEQTWTDLHTRAAKARMAILTATQTPSPAPAA